MRNTMGAQAIQRSEDSDTCFFRLLSCDNTTEIKGSHPNEFLFLRNWVLSVNVSYC